MMTKVEYALAGAQTADDVIIICLDTKGYIGVRSTLVNGPDILWAMELAKQQILEMGQPTDD